MLLASIVAVAAIAVIVSILGRRSPREWGFKDVVKNPAYWDGVNETNQATNAAIKAAESWDDAQIASATRHFILEAVSSRDAWREKQLLMHLGEKTHRAVLQLLEDTNLYSRLVKPTGEDITPEAPFNRACDLLGDAPPEVAVMPLVPFLDDAASGIRKHAILAISKTGSASIAPYVRKALSDHDSYVRSYALMGLEYALNRSGLAPSIPNELFSDVLELLRNGKNSDKAAEILYRLNSTKAADFFLSESSFTRDSQVLQDVLRTLANNQVIVPRDAILGLIQSLQTEEFKYPLTRSMGEALRLLGLHREPADREILHGWTEHSDQYVAEGAASGLLCSFDLEGFEKKIWDAEDHNTLSEHQRLYGAVFMCDAEINNGGIAQYFVNSSGDNWRDAIAGFTAMQFKERLDILREAVALFGSDGPSTNRGTRQKQLSKLYTADEAIFETLESRYYKSTEIIYVFSIRYVLANQESFR